MLVDALDHSNAIVRGIPIKAMDREQLLVETVQLIGACLAGAERIKELEAQVRALQGKLTKKRKTLRKRHGS